MKIKVSLLVFLFFTSFTNLNCQNFDFFSYLVKPIKNIQSVKQDEISIIVNHIDSIDQFYVFLLNTKNDTLSIMGLHGQPEFDISVKNASGKFEKILHRGLTCATGIMELAIPPNHYSWESKYSSRYFSGEFKTQIIFTYQIGNKIINSDPVDVSIDLESFGRYLNKEIFQNGPLEVQPKNSIEFQNFILSEAKFYHKANDFKKSVSLSKKVLEKYPDNNRAKWTMVASISNYLNYNKNQISDSDKYALISKAVILLKSIPSSSSYKEKPIELLPKLESMLPDQTEITKLYSDENCKIIDNNLVCLENFILKEDVEIIIKKIRQ